MNFKNDTSLLVKYYINWRLKISSSCPYLNVKTVDLNDNLKKSSNLLRCLCNKFEFKYKKNYTTLCSELYLTNENYKIILVNVANELFCNNTINWYRVIALFAFTGCLAMQYYQKNMPCVVHNIINWLVDYLNSNDSTVSQWIQLQGGWVNVKSS